MSAYKQFLSSDIIATPFVANKGFSFVGAAALTSSGVGIDRFLGTNITGSNFNSGSDPVTGQVNQKFQRLVYNSVQHLYFSNFMSSSYGDSINLEYIIPGEDEEGNRVVGRIHNPNFENYPQTSLTYPKTFPTGNNSNIGVISIPSSIFGEYIQPKSFFFKSSSATLQDDGEGNIINESSSYVGNIIYSHGLIILTTGSNIPNFVTSSFVTCSFSSSITIYETQYKCTISEDEFNLSLNPSLSQEVSDEIIIYDYATGSYFTPYITTVGLYNENQDLLAVAKMSQPLPTSRTVHFSVIINFDM